MLLLRLARELEYAEASLPPQPGDDWRGPARDAYALLLAGLRARLRDAREALEQAT